MAQMESLGRETSSSIQKREDVQALLRETTLIKVQKVSRAIICNQSKCLPHIQLTGQYLGQVFNWSCVCTFTLLESKTAALKVENLA